MSESDKVKAINKAKEVFRKIEKLSEAHDDFKPETFGFVMAGLNFTMSKLKKRRHVSGQELAEGIKEFASKEFGPLAHTVLDYWGIRSTGDMGRVVFALVDEGLLSKNEEDKQSDFENVYDLHEELNQNYWPRLRKKFKFHPILRMESEAKSN